MQHGMLITASQQTIWDYFKPVTRDNALCLACHKTLEKGTELTASMQAPNLKHHLKTVHPEIYVTYQLSLKQNKVSGCVQSARGERWIYSRSIKFLGQFNLDYSIPERSHELKRRTHLTR